MLSFSPPDTLGAAALEQATSLSSDARGHDEGRSSRGYSRRPISFSPPPFSPARQRLFSPPPPRLSPEGGGASGLVRSPWLQQPTAAAHNEPVSAHDSWSDGPGEPLSSLAAFDEAGRGGNDYCQNFVNTGLRPQNYIRASTIEEGLSENPRMSRLLALKEELLVERSLPPFYLDIDLRGRDLAAVLQCRFDVIHVQPQWEEYARRAAIGPSAHGQPVWTFDDLAALNISSIADTFCVMFLWCGSGGRLTTDRPSHLEEGHRLLKHWGFRRVEDIVLLKTNKSRPQARTTNPAIDSILARTKEHCLVGMRGPFRRSRDGHLIHANIHTDIIIAEESADPCCTDKPTEIYRIMEGFCLGRRRLDLFGTLNTIRPGWVGDRGQQAGGSNYDPKLYKAALNKAPGKGADGEPCPHHLLGSTPEIESLRPKTPPPASSETHHQQHKTNTHSRSSSLSRSRQEERTGRDRGEGGSRGGAAGWWPERPRAYSTPEAFSRSRGEERPERPKDRRSHTDGDVHDSYRVPSTSFSTTGSSSWYYERGRRLRSPSPPYKRTPSQWGEARRERPYQEEDSDVARGPERKRGGGHGGWSSHSP